MFNVQELTAVLNSFSQQEKAAGLKYYRSCSMRFVREEAVDQGKSWAVEFKSGRVGGVIAQMSLVRTQKEVRCTASCSCRPTKSCVHKIALLWRLLADQRDEEQWEKSQNIDDVGSAVPLIKEPNSKVGATEVRNWIGLLDSSQKPEVQELAYRLIINTSDPFEVHSTMIWRVRYTRDHSDSGKALNMPLPELNSEQLVQHPVDQKIDVLLQTQKRHNRGFVLEGPLAVDVLQAIVQTGRLYLGLESQDLLLAVEEREAQLEWQQLNDLWGFGVSGMQEHQWLIRLSVPWIVDFREKIIYPIKVNLPPPVVDSLLHAPWLSEEKLMDSLPMMQERLEPWGIMTPAVLLNMKEVRGIAPRPVLRLSRYVESRVNTEKVFLCATLYMRYETYQVCSLPPELRTIQRFPEYRVCIERMRGMEQAFLDRLRPLTPYYRLLSWQCPEPIKNSLGMQNNVLREWMFLLNDIPNLQAQGWELIIDPDFPWNPISVKPDQLGGNVSELPNGSLINLSMDFRFDGQKIALIPLLVDAMSSLSAEHIQQMMLSSNETHVFSVVHEGRILSLPMSRIKPLLGILVDLFQRNKDLSCDEQGRVRLTRLDAADFISRSSTPWQGSEGIRTLAKRMQDFSGLEPVVLPSMLKATLRPYQLEGVNWLQFLTQYQLSGILADDMGLGKTVQTTAHLCVEKVAGRLYHPALIICPKSVLPNWKQELQRFAPDFKVLQLQGAKREDLFNKITTYDIVLTNYSLLSRDIEHLQKKKWSILVCDEAQQLKNHNTLASRAIRRLKARQTLALTGTPMENHLGELWALFDFLMPGFLGLEAQFRRQVRNPIEKQGDQEVAQRLSRRIRPLMLRRTKVQVAQELPPKTEIVQRVMLSDEQRELYEVVRATMDNQIRTVVAQKGLARSSIEIIEALLKLRQVCCDPRLLKNIKLNKMIGSAKLDYLTEVLPSLVEDGRKILIFSQFTSMLALIAEKLNLLGLTYVELMGSTQDRETPVRRFQGGEVPIFLLSLKAGGVGLNLTAADTVFIYDPWWNPAAETQAADRAYRIGQDKPVFVYKLVCEDTVEEKVLEMQQRKERLAEGVYGDQAQLEKVLTPDDLQSLFKPLNKLEV